MLGTLLTKLVSENKMDYDEHLLTIFFSYITTYKVVTRYTPHQFVYGLHPLMLTKCILLVRVLTSKVSKLQKLQEDKL